MTVPDELLAELERLEAAATPGPWNFGPIQTGNTALDALLSQWRDDPAYATLSDSEFICAMRNTMPSLLAEIRELRQSLADAVREREELSTRHAELVAMLREARETIVEATWHCDKSGRSDLNDMSKKLDAALAAGR